MKTALTMALFLLATGAKAQSWFNTQTKVELTLAAGASAADAWTSRHYSSPNTYEVNPIAKPFIYSDGKTAIYFSSGYAALCGSNYLLRNHNRIRHTLNWAVIASESYWAIHNSQQRMY